MGSMKSENLHLKEMNELNKRRVSDMMTNVMRDLNEIGVVIGNVEQVNICNLKIFLLKLFVGKIYLYFKTNY